MTTATVPPPWQSLYGGIEPFAGPRRDSVLAQFRDVAARRPEAPAAIYFDGVLSYADLDRQSDALAIWMLGNGVAGGDRVAILLQNEPQFLIALLAAWKTGAVPVPMNPMYRSAELSGLFVDCQPSVIFCYSEQADVIGGCASDSARIVVCDPRANQSTDDARVLPQTGVCPDGMITFARACSATGAPRPVDPLGEDLGLILYTSGTTGKPKGAMARHLALATNGAALAHWCALGEETRILAIAPLFHITGLVCHVAAAFAAGAALVLNYRFEAGSVLDAIRRTSPTFTIGAITAFNALMNADGATKADFSSLESVYSGGAPIPPSLRDEFLERTGLLLHTSYGMTETAAQTHLCPPGVKAPVDTESGALAIGVPIFGTQAKIVSDDGCDVKAGTAGELWLKGPQVMMGYWNQPAATDEAMADGWLRSGDIAVMDRDGWFYLVDRKKDVIIASGFKVWPREVEDVLYAHPAVREVAVVGQPDDYRGETVKAVVSLVEGRSVEPDALIAFCRDRMASYKAPRVVEIVGDLPKTPTGKIMRAALRQAAPVTKNQSFDT